MTTALLVSLALNALLICILALKDRWSSEALERSHIRTTSYTQDLVDRLAARDWREYVEVREAPLAEFDEPTPELELVPTLGADRGGFGSRLGLRAWNGDPDATLEEE